MPYIVYTLGQYIYFRAQVFLSTYMDLWDDFRGFQGLDSFGLSEVGTSLVQALGDL